MSGKNKHFLISLSQNKGALLVEIMLTVALFTILSMSIAAMLLVSGVLYRTNDAHARLNENVMKTLHYIEREIRETSTTSTRLVFNGANCDGVVCFQIPVDFDDDDDVTLDNTDSPSQWGAYDYAGQVKVDNAAIEGRWVRYSVNNKQLIRDVLVGPDSDSAADPILTTVVANNVEAFNITQPNNNSITINITLEAKDNIGQAGAERSWQTSFSHSLYLRNAAN